MVVCIYTHFRGVLISEVEMHARVVYLGVGIGVLFREVSSFQRLKEWYLGWKKLSCLERCPQFKSVLIQRGSTVV